MNTQLETRPTWGSVITPKVQTLANQVFGDFNWDELDCHLHPNSEAIRRQNTIYRVFLNHKKNKPIDMVRHFIETERKLDYDSDHPDLLGWFQEMLTEERPEEPDCFDFLVFEKEGNEPIGIALTDRHVFTSQRDHLEDLTLSYATTVSYVYVRPDYRAKGYSNALATSIAHFMIEDISNILSVNSDLSPIHIGVMLRADVLSMRAYQFMMNVFEYMEILKDMLMTVWPERFKTIDISEDIEI